MPQCSLCGTEMRVAGAPCPQCGAIRQSARAKSSLKNYRLANVWETTASGLRLYVYSINLLAALLLGWMIYLYFMVIRPMGQGRGLEMGSISLAVKIFVVAMMMAYGVMSLGLWRFAQIPQSIRGRNFALAAFALTTIDYIILVVASVRFLLGYSETVDLRSNFSGLFISFFVLWAVSHCAEVLDEMLLAYEGRAAVRMLIYGIIGGAVYLGLATVSPWILADFAPLVLVGGLVLLLVYLRKLFTVSADLARAIDQRVRELRG